MKISLRYKVLALLGTLLIGSLAGETWLASRVFREQKVALLYDVNHSIAVATAAEIKASLTQTVGHLKLFAMTAATDHSDLKLPLDFLADAHVSALQEFRKNSAVNTADAYQDATPGLAIPTLGLTAAQALPHLKETEEKNQTFWSARTDDSASFFISTRIDIPVAGRTDTYLVLAQLDNRAFFRELQLANLFHAYLVRGDGQVMVECEESTLSFAPKMKDHPLFKAGVAHPSSSGLLPYSYAGDDWYGAFAPVGVGDLFLLTAASRTEVTSATDTLKNRTLLLAAFLLTFAFIISLLFSAQLIHPIFSLRDGFSHLENGEFRYRMKVTSHDEFRDAVLAFNTMASRLGQTLDSATKSRQTLEEKLTAHAKDLEQMDLEKQKLQEKQVRASQLAAVGEVTVHTTRELLTPLNSILHRIERSRSLDEVAEPEPALPHQMGEILSNWESDFREGGMSRLVEGFQSPSVLHANLTLFEEDLDNLKKIAHYWQSQMESATDDLMFVKEQAKHIQRIISQTHELSEAPVKEDVHCQAAVKEAVETMKDFLVRYKIVLDEQLAAPHDTATLNRDELVRIIDGLIRNACQSIRLRVAEDPFHRGVVRVETSSGTRTMAIDVIDSGIGVPRNQRQEIFEPTGELSEGERFFNLAPCRKQARAFGGEVELLFSEPTGRGTCFRVIVPLKDAQFSEAV